jgi:hypothetical protein
MEERTQVMPRRLRRSFQRRRKKMKFPSMSSMKLKRKR